MGSIPTSGTNLKLLAVRNNGKLKEILGSSPRAGSYIFLHNIGVLAQAVVIATPCEWSELVRFQSHTT